MRRRILCSRSALARIGVLVDLPAHHLVDQLQARQIGGHVLAFQFAVAQNRDAVRDRIRLIQEMGHEENGNALGLELSQGFKQATDFVFIETGRRLVENQDLRLGAQGTGDGDHLLNGHRITRQRERHIGRNIQRFKRGTCALMHLWPVNDRSAHGKSTDVDVFRHREIRAEIDFLINRTDAEVLCFKHGRGLNLLAAEANFTAIGCFNARQDLDQGRLPCPILPHQGMHFTGKESDSDILERNDTRKPLVDALHLEDWLLRHGD